MSESASPAAASQEISFQDSRSTSRENSPRISVVFPLVDDRGAGEEAFAGWISQDAPPEWFELIVVDGRRNPKLANAVRRQLRPGDRLVEIDSANEAELYNAGAAAASAPLLFFTESHVLPRPDVVRQVVRHFLETRDDAAAVASEHSSRNRVALVDECLFERELPGVLQAEPWRWVSLRSFAARKAVFREFGPFDEDCRRFAETVFGLRLRDAGLRIGWINSTKLAHVNIQTVANMAADLRNCAIGQAAFRERATPEQVAALGDFGHHDERPLGVPQIAACVLRASLATLARDWFRRGCGRRNRALARQLPLLAATVAWGEQARWRLATLKAQLLGLLFLGRLALRPGKTSQDMVSLLPLFFRLRVAWTRVGQWEQLVLASDQPLWQRIADNVETPIDELPAAALAGFLPRELWGGSVCRWSQPFATLRLARGPFDGWLALKCDTLTPVRDRRMRVFWNGELKPDTDVRQTGDWLRIRVSKSECQSDEQVLTMACVPMRPSAVGVADQRRLGIAIHSLRVETAARRSAESLVETLAEAVHA